MSKKTMTVQEKQRELVEEAVQASRNIFAALREAKAEAAKIHVLAEAETKLLADAKLTAPNPGDIPQRRIANYQWRIIPELFSGILPLDSMEAEASSAREQLKNF